MLAMVKGAGSSGQGGYSWRSRWVQTRFKLCTVDT